MQKAKNTIFRTEAPKKRNKVKKSFSEFPECEESARRVRGECEESARRVRGECGESARRVRGKCE